MTPPLGQVVLVFTDVEASTALWVAQGEAFRVALARHDALLRDAMARWGGYEVKAMGDAFMVAFADADAALAFCVDAAAALAREPWGGAGPIRVRMGLHVGEPILQPTPTTGRMDYLGPDVIKASRLHVAAHGGQILLSDELRQALRQPPALLDLGPVALRGLGGAHRVWQVGTAAFPPIRTALPARTNLPAPVDAFVGRTAEVEALLALLHQGPRLVTLTGPGGTGKTRLSCEVGGRALEWGPVWFIDLSEARDGAGLLAATAEALGLVLGAGPTEQLIDQIGAAIAGRGATLLIFDNVEQVVAHIAPLGRWLARAPEARMLATSRVPLQLRGERLFPVEPLPDADGVALLRERAARPLGDDEPLAELARALDGLPLAIELAAARTAALRPAQILARLEDRFRLLVSKGGDRPPRHATLRAAMDWSLELLTPDEQRAMAWLSVFEGGFSLEAAEAVLPDPDPLARTAALVDHSLLRRAGDRYGFLATVHAYARERLGEDRTRAEAAHAAFFGQLGEEEALAALRRAGGVARQQALRAERENLLAAARRGSAEAAAGAALAAWEIFEIYGPFSEGERLLTLLLARTDLSPRARARLLERRGEAERLLGRLGEAAATLTEAADHHRGLGDGVAEGRTRGRLARALGDQGLLDAARGVCDAALGLARAHGDTVGEADALELLGGMARTLGAPEQSRAAFDQALALYRARGDARGEALLLGGLGHLAVEQGRGQEARGHYETALALNRVLGNRRAEASQLQNLGVVHRALGDADAAHRWYRAALALHRALGNRRGEGLVMGNLANLLSADAPDEALALYEAALRIHEEIGNRRSQTVDQGNLGVLHLEQGRMEEARAALTAAIDRARLLGLAQADGVFTGKLALLRLMEGDAAGALVETVAAEPSLRKVGDPVELGRLMLTRARAADGLGDAETREAAIREAEACVERSDSVEFAAEVAKWRGRAGR